MKKHKIKALIAQALANYDPDQVRGTAGAFSAASTDAVAQAAQASQEAHAAGTEPAHRRAAKLQRGAAAKLRADGKEQYARAHEGLATAHDQLADCCAMGLGNSEAGLIGVYDALANEGIDSQGWALIAPFGEWPKTRVYREGGQVKEQQFIQVLNNESADAMLAKENSFFRSLRRALVGIPVYKGHGDLNDADPKAVANETRKIKLGVVDQIRKGARGMEAHFALDNDGAQAVAEGWKYPSAFWWVLPNGKRGDATLVQPFKLISVALTPYPNISGVESLANARPTTPAAREHKVTKDKHMKELLIGWLAAKGIVLANDASESQILKSVQDHCASQSSAATAFGNEKTTLTGQVTALTNDRDAQKQRADTAATALANEQSARKADRKAAAELITDTAVKLGLLSVAERDGQVTALENSADFGKDAKALLAKEATHKTVQSGRDVSGKQGAALANEQEETRRQYDAAFAKELPLANQDPVKAHRAIMSKPEYSALAQKLLPRN